MKFTSEILQQLKSLFDFRPIVGIACCPEVKAMIDKCTPASDPWGPPPIIVDPRLTKETTEIYRDYELWSNRMREQNDWHEEEYFIECAKHCTCDHDICDSVLAGAPCEDRHDYREDL